MKRFRALKIALLALIALIVAYYSVWLVRMYVTDRGLFLSHILNAWHDGRFRAFHRLFYEVEIGMTREELMKAIDKVYPAEGVRKRPQFSLNEPTHITLFMDPESSREPNCEGIFLSIVNGRIVKKGYGMD